MGQSLPAGLMKPENTFRSDRDKILSFQNKKYSNYVLY
jgi:hypothetical protein